MQSRIKTAYTRDHGMMLQGNLLSVMCAVNIARDSEVAPSR